MTHPDPLAETLPGKRRPPSSWMTGFILMAGLLACAALTFAAWQFVAPEPASMDFSDLALTATAQPSATALSFSEPVLPSLVTEQPPPRAEDAYEPAGQIVYVCQVFRASAADQICVMNADGSGSRRITTRDAARHFYPSFAPEGNSVLFVSNMNGTKDARGNIAYEIFEQSLVTGELWQLTDRLGIVTAPEISPDGTQIVFKNSDGRLNDIWLMARDGGNPRRIFGSQTAQGWDPAWSPDGSQILFAGYDPYFVVQLFIMDADGGNVRQVTQMRKLRGRTDWSPQGLIVTYAGDPWNRELYLMNTDGSNLRQLTPAGGNSQGPSFSSDGNWVAFTAYFDRYGDDNGCEIYIIRTDGSDLRRLTDNAYCDWQPRWGP